MSTLMALPLGVKIVLGIVVAICLYALATMDKQEQSYFSFCAEL